MDPFDVGHSCSARLLVCLCGAHALTALATYVHCRSCTVQMLEAGMHTTLFSLFEYSGIL
eukprot:2033522-Pyramimonas_sp.AAC.2